MPTTLNADATWILEDLVTSDATPNSKQGRLYKAGAKVPLDQLLSLGYVEVKHVKHPKGEYLARLTPKGVAAFMATVR